jgi:hypothetical protein
MKKLIRAERNLHSDLGTTFYKVTLEQLKDAFSNDNIMNNILILGAIDVQGFNALNLKALFGSVVVEDILYLCKTDGNEIEVDGKLINPEYAIEEYGIESIQSMIQDSTPEIILKDVTEYEIAPDFDEVALYLLNSGHSFHSLVEAANESMWFDD